MLTKDRRSRRRASRQSLPAGPVVALRRGQGI